MESRILVVVVLSRLFSLPVDTKAGLSIKIEFKIYRQGRLAITYVGDTGTDPPGRFLKLGYSAPRICEPMGRWERRGWRAWPLRLQAARQKEQRELVVGNRGLKEGAPQKEQSGGCFLLWRARWPYCIE